MLGPFNPEIEFTNDLENNMEPKWGQLANKQEILDEIRKVNLANLKFEQQITALANHFEKHLRYDINSSNMPYIFDPSKDVNRYVYSEVGGWIDFHHVFKIFEWATQNGPFSWVTRHLSNVLKVHRYKERATAHVGSSCGSFASSVTASNYNYIVNFIKH